MPAARAALIALAAGDKRVDGNALAGLELCYRASDFHRRSRTLVANPFWKLHHLGADAPRGVIVHIRPADAHRVHAQ